MRTVKMISVRSTFSPSSFEVNAGDEVTVAITNIEQTTDELHGFGLLDYNINVVIDPGETKTVTFTAKKGGVFAYNSKNVSVTNVVVWNSASGFVLDSVSNSVLTGDSVNTSSKYGIYFI